MRTLTAQTRIAACAALITAVAGPATAAVRNADANGFTVESTIEVDRPTHRVWMALVEQIGDWWHPDHTWSGDSKNLRIDPRPGGCFCETLPEHGGARHLSVEFVKPPTLLRMRGGLGPLQEMAVVGSLTFTITELEDGRSRIRLSYAVGGYLDGGLGPLAAVVDSVLGMQLERLASYVDTGAPERSTEKQRAPATEP